MTGAAHLSFAMGALTAAGGVMGYAKGKSLPSLGAGCALGAAFIASGILINRGDGAQGHSVALGASMTFASLMAHRFGKTRKIMPAGIGMLVGGLSTLYQTNKVMEWTAPAEE
mmetsp:Transcript_22473/g.72333  ORF Transcript_22473/g.72333 Transcript_22473/m.72333 type:complete len:113 (-) Transcript_22473:90-428(-)